MNLKAYEKLYTSASCTSDYRFNTYRRLSNLDITSNIALIFSSTSLIVVSFITSTCSDNLKEHKLIIDIIQQCLPVVMLSLSILISSSKYGARAEKIHTCAQELSNLKKMLYFDINDEKFTPSKESFKRYAKKYYEIILSHENHSKLDSFIEDVRKKDCVFLKTFADIIGKGFAYYFYLSITAGSIYWMVFISSLLIKIKC
jgi:hypothetical protein